jgi:hypothetical protein
MDAINKSTGCSHMTAYDISIEVDRRLLRMTMRGYWDSATFDLFARDFRKALDHLALHGGARLAFVDGRDFAVQSVEITEKFGALIAASYGAMAPRTATLVAGTLNKLQSDHAGMQGSARYFSDPAAAEAWLFEETETAQPRRRMM